MITVIGLGFVGLTTALGFSEKGFQVYGYDIDKNKTRTLRKGKLPFHEPGVDTALIKHLGEKFIITDNLSEGVKKSEMIFICVGTPSTKDGSADLKYIYSAIESSLKHIDTFKTLVIKSTVPPLTTSEKLKPFIERCGFKVGKDIGLANNPEFLREGTAWQDFMNCDRIVLGVSEDRSKQSLEDVYKPFRAPIHVVSLNTGEFIKYLSNSLLATLISWSNEMSIIARKIGDIEIAKSFKILHEDGRWFGKPANIATYAYPGCGYGGYCLPKDTSALCATAESKNYEPKILKNVIEVNNKMKDYVVELVLDKIKPHDRIGILGLSFKPNSDDVRESPAADIIKLLKSKCDNSITAYDPMAMEVFESEYKLGIAYADSFEVIVNKADFFVLLTAWQEFRDKKDLLKGKELLDFRYFLI